MWVESQNDSLEKQNTQKFEWAFKENMDDPTFDRQAFWDLISWTKFDDNKSWEENLKGALNQKIWELTDKHKANLTPENREKLETLQRAVVEWTSDPKEIVEAFKEIKWVVNWRAWESVKWQQDQQAQKEKKAQSESNSKLQEYIDALKDALKESAEKIRKDAEKAKEANNAWNKAKEESWEEAESAMLDFPPSEKTPDTKKA